MKTELIISVGVGEFFAALLENDELVELHIERRRRGPKREAVYVARVAKLLPETNSAILDLGNGEAATLPARHAHAARKGAKRTKRISDLVREGEHLHVEIIREARDSGSEFKHAIAKLRRRTEPATVRALDTGLVQEAPTALLRMTRERPEGTKYRVDDATTYAELRAHIGSNAAECVTLEHNGHFWEESGAADALEQIAEGRIPIEGGGSLLVETAAGVTVIDVNTGPAIASDARAATNLAAAREVARQLRLQDLSGPIIVDFIGGGRAIDAKAVLAAFDNASRADRRVVQRSDISRFGMLEITRERRGRPVRDSLCAPTHRRRSIEGRVYELLRRALNEARTVRGGNLVLKMPSQLRDWLERRPELIAELEHRSGRRVTIGDDAEPDAYVSQPTGVET